MLHNYVMWFAVDQWITYYGPKAGRRDKLESPMAKPIPGLVLSHNSIPSNPFLLEWRAIAGWSTRNHSYFLGTTLIQLITPASCPYPSIPGFTPRDILLWRSPVTQPFHVQKP